jgi:iron complex outermembrane receptor protein
VLPAAVVGSAADYRVYQFHGEKAIVSAFASHLMRPFERIAVQADLQVTYRRYRHHDEQFFERAFEVPYVFANPRVGVTLNPERPFSLYASFALASREPRLKSLYDGEEAGAGFQPRFEEGADGRPDFDRPLVSPEHLLDLELGGSLRRERFSLAANLFWMEFRDEIVPSGGLDQFGVPRSGNADRTRHLGIEAEGAVRLVPGLDLTANASLSHNRFVEFDEFVSSASGAAPVSRDGNPIAGFPDRVANASLSYTLRGMRLHLAAKYTGKQYIDNSGGETADGAPAKELTVSSSVILDAGIRYAFDARTALDGLEAALDVNNVLDERVLLFGNVGPAGPQFFPLATRHLFATLRYTLR